MKSEKKDAAGAQQAPCAGKGGQAQPGNAAAAAKGAIPAIRLSERDRRAAFALLAVLAAGLAAYVLFLAEPADPEADIDTFMGSVLSSQSVALFFDMRGSQPEDASRIYQCGVDIAGGSLFGSKTVSTYACDDSECIFANSAQNGSGRLTYEQVKMSLRGVPYILVRGGAPSTKFFSRHAEITVDESFSQSCKLG